MLLSVGSVTTPSHRKARSRRPRVTTLFILAFVWCLTLGQGLAECPRACECKWKSGKEAVLCINSNLTSIPQELDAGTQVLDFTGNLLTEINKDAFSNAGLTNLQKIYLSKCRIKKLDRYTFRKLTNLVELDFSYNLLTSVPSHIFDSISELREIKLSGNPIQRILNDAFQRVPQLVRLELSECRLGTVEARAFNGLQALEWLKLDTNQLSSIRPTTVTNLKSLHGLDLHANPWNCSCTLRPLREWMIRQNIPYSVPPACRSPPRIASRSWDKLELDDFACVPGIMAKIAVTKGVEGSNVTMSCNIDGVPEPKVKWIWKNRIIANLTASTFGRKTYVLQEIGDTEKASNLTILAADVQDAGVYICTAENKAGKVEANVTLAMSRKAPDPGLSIRVIIAGAIVAALFILAVCLMAICMCSMRRKQDNIRVARHNRREDSYEKIEMNHKPPTMNHTATSNGPGSSGVAMSPASLQTIRHPRHAEYRGVPCDVSSPGQGRKQSPQSVKLDGAWSARSPDGAGSSEAGHNADTESCTARSTLMSDSEASDPDTLRSALPSYREHREEVGYTHGPIRRPPAPSYQFTSADLVASPGDCRLESREASIEMKDLHIHAPPLPPDPDADGAETPDIIGVSTYNDPGHYGTESFCTLPRRRYERNNPRWRRGGCSDSQSPLLPDSRYNSSEDSGGSIRRYSGETTVTTVNYRQRSSSSLNLPSDHYREQFTASAAVVSAGVAAAIGGIHRPQGLPRYPSLPTSPVMESLSGGVNTPLLGNHQNEYHPVYATPATPSNVVNSYDYHAAQLERFLEEYRSLQEQLSKMKETCDSLRHDSTTPTTRSNNTRSLVEPLNVNALTTPDDNPRSILKSNNNKPSSSTSPLSGGPSSINQGAGGPAPPPYWVPRTSLRRFSGDFYQS